MEDTALIKIFKRLGQGSKRSVQNGQALDDFDQYMHVDRPIERAVRDAMDDIRQADGGILFLVGSAGDGKSHIISSLRQEYSDFAFQNDASESPWPKIESIDALKIFLADFKDATLHTTKTKMLVAINMGRLSAFIDDEVVQNDFKEIVQYAKTLFDDDNHRQQETKKVKIVSFANHQLFEIFPEQKDDVYPIDSLFIKSVLRKITNNTAENVFYQVFKDSTPTGDNFDPSYINYQLLCIPKLQDAIVKFIIEAIIRFKLTLTPRELFDFIFRIVVPDNYTTFNSSKDFFKSLLPSIMFGGGENKVLKSISLLDPLKYGSIKHNDELSDLFASIDIPEENCFKQLRDTIHVRFFELLKEFYQNNRNNIEDISKLLFRLKHLLDYHSESDEYRDFLGILCGYYNNDEDKLSELYEMIQRSLPHFYGSYTDKSSLVPLPIQGKEYKMFVSCENIKPNPQEAILFDKSNRNKFVIKINTQWKVSSNIPLKVEYSLFEYLCKIQKGKLAQTDDRNQNLSFSKFINSLIQQSDYNERVIILTADNRQLTLSRSFGKKVILK